MQIFGAQRHMLCDHRFDAAASGIADLRTGHAELVVVEGNAPPAPAIGDVTGGNAYRTIEQHPIERKTKASAHGRQPGYLVGSRYAAHAASAAGKLARRSEGLRYADMAHVSFDTENEAVHLPVIAALAAKTCAVLARSEPG